MNIVIVESPAKAKTINKYLGKNFQVVASYGHIRDLPPKDGSVLPEKNFEMLWDISKGSDKHIRNISQLVKGAEGVYLATDPDREGEAIAWHVCEVLRRKKLLKNLVIKRVTFNEITKKAVLDAMAHPRELNSELIEAYLARRALDYLVGFNISPVLWRKLPGSRSAGRVQSVALRLICEREEEIEKFSSQEYWTISGLFETTDKKSVPARLTHFNKAKLDKFAITNEKQACETQKELESCSYNVRSVESKKVQRHPKPPFTTSTLQQAASRLLRLSATQIMRIAQQLYEGITINGENIGLITYMRTDSVQLSDDAIKSCRKLIKTDYPECLPGKKRVYKSKAKNAQEAHEAIRPSDFSLTPSKLKKYLDDQQFSLYRLIWQRAVASQMESAIFDQVVVEIQDQKQKHTFRATGSVISFRGFLQVYQDMEEEDKDNQLPVVKEQDSLNVCQISPHQHFTQPPPRFSEASLVKKLEELGIGRPSTYATILQVLRDRNYVKMEQRRFFLEDRGRLVTVFLRNFFAKYVEYDFTASLEDKLDQISNGKIDWKDVLNEFWNPFSSAVKDAKELTISEVIEKIDQDMSDYLFPKKNDENPRKCLSCSDGELNLKLGKYGAFIGCVNYPECRYTRQIQEEADEQAAVDNGLTVLGQNAKNSLDVSLRKGPYGYYIQEGEEEVVEGSKGKKRKKKPKRVSLPSDVRPEDINLEKALQYLSLPKDLGIHPKTNDKIIVNIGKYGPYLKTGTTSVSLPKDRNMFAVDTEEAIELLNQSLIKSEPRVLGVHPEDQKEVTVQIGRYGPYIKHNKKNVKLPNKDMVTTITLEEAIVLLDKKNSEKPNKPENKDVKEKKEKKETKGKKTTTKKASSKAKEKVKVI